MERYSFFLSQISSNFHRWSFIYMIIFDNNILQTIFYQSKDGKSSSRYLFVMAFPAKAFNIPN